MLTTSRGRPGVPGGQTVPVLCPVCLPRPSAGYRPQPSAQMQNGLQEGEPASDLPRQLHALPARMRPTPGSPHPRPALSPLQARSSEDGSEAPGGHPACLPILQMRKRRPSAQKGIVRGHQKLVPGPRDRASSYPLPTPTHYPGSLSHTN